MFMCEECHQEDQKKYDCFHPFKSYGKCEICDKVKECVDCKAYKRGTPQVPAEVRKDAFKEYLRGIINQHTCVTKKCNTEGHRHAQEALGLWKEHFQEEKP